MSPRYLLDANIVSEPMRSRPNPATLRRMRDHAAECALAAPVWHELKYGCERLPAGKRRDALELYLQAAVQPHFPVLPYDEAAAAWHAGERARLERAGQTAPFVDGQIAAIAVVHGLALVTGNVRDFAGFRGLTVVNWLRR